MQVSTRDLFGYAMLPRILPRMRELLSLTFSHTAYFIALLFEAVRLLPSEHPYLKSVYFGQYGVYQVLREAFKRLRFDLKHIDQVLIYFTIVLGMLIFMAQLVIITVTFLFPAAYATTLVAPFTLDDELAATFTLSSIIETRFPCNDIAFMILDRVFGVPDMYESRYSTAFDTIGRDTCALAGTPAPRNVASTTVFPYPYHFGLQALFMTFSVAMLAVALLVLTYFVITIFAETVRDGTPFGKRFNRVWAPIRLVMAFGLLIPLTNGLNSAQYIVLVAAKWGSGFATNALTYYYGEIRVGPAGGTPFGQPDTLMATPNPPDPINLLHFMLTARACQFAVQFDQTFDDDVPVPTGVVTPINGWYIREGVGPEPPLVADLAPGFGQMGRNGTPLTGVPGPGVFLPIMTATNYESINIIFGHRSADPNVDLYPGDYGGVHPFCGRITMSIVTNDTNPMALELQEIYLRLAAAMWQDPEIIDAAAAIAASKFGGVGSIPCGTVPTHYPMGGAACPPGPIPNITDLKAAKVEQYKELLRTDAIEQVMTNYVGGTYDADFEWCGPAEDPWLLSYGWAGAAICYNKIAQYNGDFTAAARALPVPHKWPAIMENVLQLRQAAEQNITTHDRFNPVLIGENTTQDIFQTDEPARTVAHASYEAYRLWIISGQGSGDGGSPDLSGVGIKDIINLIFGTEGIFNMSKPENRDIHPLALLASAGRGLIESAIFNIGVAGLGLGAAIVTPWGSLGTVLGSFMLTAATISVSAGFVLFYIIPLMPFMYFFFAVSSWIKTIFEAMVGVPLWALAHLRIDGDGIPGQAAMTGYLLILEIFLRPVLIIFGLLASSLIFSATVKILNELWASVVENLTGFDSVEANPANPLEIRFWRQPIDEFFYTVIYVIIVYMLALASFKLVDLIPNYILRWLGQSVETFSDGQEDYAAQLSQKSTFGFSAASSRVISGAEELGTGISRSSQGYRAAKQAAEGSD